MLPVSVCSRCHRCNLPLPPLPHVNASTATAAATVCVFHFSVNASLSSVVHISSVESSTLFCMSFARLHVLLDDHPMIPFRVAEAAREHLLGYCDPFVPHAISISLTVFQCIYLLSLPVFVCNRCRRCHRCNLPVQPMPHAGAICFYLLLFARCPVVPFACAFGPLPCASGPLPFARCHLPFAVLPFLRLVYIKINIHVCMYVCK